MRIETGLSGANRKLLAQAICLYLQEEPHYNGVPTCSYGIGAVTVERDGAIVSDDSQAWETLISLFQNHGWMPTDAETDLEPQSGGNETEEAPMIESLELSAETMEPPTNAPDDEEDAAQPIPDAPGAPEDSEAAADRQLEPKESSNPLVPLVISVPIGDMVVDQMKNLIFILHSKQYLMNRAYGYAVFHISEAIVNRLKEYRPADMDAFAALLGDFKASGELSGFELEDGKVSMTFPADAAIPERCMIYTELFCRIIRLAKAATRVNPELQSPENEKYYMRSWLIRLGMGGADFKAARYILLNNLNGYSAFPTDAAAQKHKEKYAAIRREAHRVTGRNDENK